MTPEPEAAVRTSIEERLLAAGLPPLPRPCWLEIDLEALAANLRLLRGLAGEGVALNAVVKADAYGHGLEAVARALESAGADRLCVATLDEALLLRASGSRLPILVLFPIPADAVGDAARAGVEIVATTEWSIGETLERWTAGGLAEPGAELRVHLEVETGLSRGGVRPAAAGRLAQRIGTTRGCRLVGLWSHLATPADEAVTAGQVAEFESAVAAVRDAGVPIPERHLAATGGLFTSGVPAYEGVRPGLALYGLLPADLPLAGAARDAAAGLRPVMALKCRALRLEQITAGTTVSYGGRWRSERTSLIATLPVGYGDGWARSPAPISGRAIVRGQTVPLVGTVAMDAVMADVTDVPGIGPADEFVLLGEQGAERISANDLAHARTTIPWEIVTTMAQRLPRVYHAGAVLVGTRTLEGEARAT